MTRGARGVALLLGTVLSATVAVVVGGCGSGSPPAELPASSVRDSAGVRIVENVRPAWREGDAWVVGAPQVTIGDEPGDELFNVAGATLLSAGRVAVALAGVSEVRVYDAEGRRSATWGGPGDGPEEFRILASIGHTPGDTLWVHDYGASRVAYLTPGGGFAGVLALTPPLPAGMVVGRRADGSFVLGQAWGSPPRGAPISEGLVRDPAAYVVYMADGRGGDTLGFFPGREVLHRSENGRMVMGVAPFARRASDALVGDDLVVGDQVARRFQVLDGAGHLTLVRWPGAPIDVRTEDVRAWKESRLEETAEAERPALRAWLDDVAVPPTRPAYGAFLADPAGALWVAAYAPPDEMPSEWDVFDLSWRWLGSVRMPDGFQPLEVGRDRIVGLTRDDLDVERVEVRPLVRGS